MWNSKGPVIFKCDVLDERDGSVKELMCRQEKKNNFRDAPDNTVLPNCRNTSRTENLNRSHHTLAQSAMEMYQDTKKLSIV
jgi:hypothetical protein